MSVGVGAGVGGVGGVGLVLPLCETVIVTDFDPSVVLTINEPFLPVELLLASMEIVSVLPFLETVYQLPVVFSRSQLRLQVTVTVRVAASGGTEIDELLTLSVTSQDLGILYFLTIFNQMYYINGFWAVPSFQLHHARY